MKRKYIYLIIAIVILLVMFFPYKQTRHADGTTEYIALSAKYISWHYSQSIGDSVAQATTFRVYFFPENLEEYQTLRDKFFESRL